EDYLEYLSEDIIFKTPGISINTPQLVKARNEGAVITSEMEVFFELCPASIIAVTGSDGKTTTTTLIFEMLKCQGYKCHLGGNIGKPLLSEIESISCDDKVILELSSFQLQTMTSSPQTAVVTNISPNHLDFHKSMEEYIDAKENIYSYQNKNGKLVLNFDNEITKSFAEKAKGTVISFCRSGKKGVYIKDEYIFMDEKPILRCDDILIPGNHNIENYMAAIGAVWGIVDIPNIQRVAKTFGGVEHRIEFVREIDGIKFYNDSIASSPTRARACLYSFDKKVIIIAGGYDKKIPFDDFGNDIVKRVKTLVLMGETATKIKTAVENAEGEKPPVIMADNL
ncbi:MAG: UDP-N-acetylmuramoyl-L-alanine--D-glutamate ligase, partial [Candidatus Moranbacteria bacterium]|nr:UDP-N-acetylmuramoyl-L-alanine--D-glutamate ligase [Candidatus Moranbacteria bacterium]